MKVYAISRLPLAAIIFLIAIAGTRGGDTNCTNFSAKVDPSCASYYSRVGTDYYRKGEYDSAIQALTEAIRMDGNFSFALFTRGQAYAAKGDDESAMQDFKVVISGGGPPQDSRIVAWAHYARGLLRLKRKQYDKALDDFDAAHHIDRIFKEAYRAQAEVLFRQKHFAEALVAVNRALWVAPFYPDGFATRARILNALGRTADALADNAQAGALFVPTPSLAKSYHRLYHSPAAACMDDDKHLIQVSMRRGLIKVQPLYVGTDARTSVRHDKESIMLRVGREGCRVDVEVGKDINAVPGKERVVSGLQNVDLSPSGEPPAFALNVYSDPLPTCADTKIIIRAFWGFVEIQDNYHSPRGEARALGLSRGYGSEECKIVLRVLKVD
jgi:Tfp pilus assembly protein PilF